jgi:hypothetical protein
MVQIHRARISVHKCTKVYKKCTKVYFGYLKSQIYSEKQMFGDYFRKTAEFKRFLDLVDRTLSRRGKQRATYRQQLEDHFLKVWINSQMNSKDQLTELMKDKKNLRRLIIELNEEHKVELDDLEREIERLKVP